MTKATLLESIQGNQRFFLSDGSVIASLHELALKLPFLADHVFGCHVTSSRNDFAEWVKNIYDEPALSDEMRKVPSKHALSVLLLQTLMKALESHGIKESLNELPQAPLHLHDDPQVLSSHDKLRDLIEKEERRLKDEERQRSNPIVPSRSQHHAQGKQEQLRQEQSRQELNRHDQTRQQLATTAQGTRSQEWRNVIPSSRLSSQTQDDEEELTAHGNEPVAAPSADIISQLAMDIERRLAALSQTKPLFNQPLSESQSTASARDVLFTSSSASSRQQLSNERQQKNNRHMPRQESRHSPSTEPLELIWDDEESEGDAVFSSFTTPGQTTSATATYVPSAPATIVAANYLPRHILESAKTASRTSSFAPSPGKSTRAAASVFTNTAPAAKEEAGLSTYFGTEDMDLESALNELKAEQEHIARASLFDAAPGTDDTNPEELFITPVTAQKSAHVSSSNGSSRTASSTANNMFDEDESMIIEREKTPEDVFGPSKASRASVATSAVDPTFFQNGVEEPSVFSNVAAKIKKWKPVAWLIDPESADDVDQRIIDRIIAEEQTKKIGKSAPEPPDTGFFH